MSYCGGRLGSSGQTYGGTAVDYFPSLKPLAPAAEHVPAGQATAAQVRLTNWGASATPSTSPTPSRP